MKQSIWNEQTKLPGFEKLKGDIKTDVLIIGGGMCGILCAYFLQKQGIEYILVEGGTIASGVTKNTTAKITSQHGLIYNKLIKAYGTEKAEMYLDANEKAISMYEDISAGMDCDFERRSGFVYSLSDAQKIEDEVAAVNSLGYGAGFSKNLELPFDTCGAICFSNQAQFNPIKFIKSIVHNLNIYENTFVQEIMPYMAAGKDFRIRAKKIIVATHFPFLNKHGSYFLKLYQHRSYVAAFMNAPRMKGMYVDENEKGMSFRSYNNHLLIGGGGHRTGKKGGAWKEIEDFAKAHYPGAELCYEWAAQDCMSLDSIPYIGRYSLRTPDLYVATGFNKWGMTSSMVAAMMLADMVMDKRNDYEQVFSPSRSILKPQLFINSVESAFNLLTPTKRRCPHLGCALKWNKAEHTWDCPCHGSRFRQSGELINNPAMKNIAKPNDTKQ